MAIPDRFACLWHSCFCYPIYLAVAVITENQYRKAVKSLICKNGGVGEHGKEMELAPPPPTRQGKINKASTCHTEKEDEESGKGVSQDGC